MSNPNINPTKIIIPVDEAIAKTTQWRKFIAEACPEMATEDLPKGVYISKNDIMDMANYCYADETILGVRAYFTLEDNPLKPGVNQVKFIMVLVQDDPEIWNGKDLLYIPTGLKNQALSPDDGGDDDSNIYDFTA